MLAQLGIKILTDNGGDVMNEKADNTAGDSYFTSTEADDASKVFYVRFGQWNPGLTGAKICQICLHGMYVVSEKFPNKTL